MGRAEFLRLGATTVFSLFTGWLAWMLIGVAGVFVAWLIFYASMLYISAYNQAASEARGVAIAVASFLIALLGETYARSIAYDPIWVIEIVSEFLLIFGTGVGVSVFAAGVISRSNDAA